MIQTLPQKNIEYRGKNSHLSLEKTLMNNKNSQINDSMYFLINSVINIVKIQNITFKKIEMTLVQTEYDYVFKILLIGNIGVGKSSLLMRFASDIFSESFLPTLGVDFKIRTMQAGEKLLKLQIWDTAGQEKFKNIVASYYRGTHGILLVFDITNKNSFLDVQTWVQEAEKYSPEGVVRILIGNKKDLHLERSVTYEEAKNFAESLGIHYLETSAKQSINIEESFTTLVIDMKKKFPSQQKNGPLMGKSKTRVTTCC